MRVTAGRSYRTYEGESFGPMHASGPKYSLPFYTVKLGQVFTFHENGQYSNDKEKRHFLDLVS